MKLTIATWNMRGRRSNWPLVPLIGADVVLLQEAPPPPPQFEGTAHLAPFDDGRRPWGTGIWARDLQIEPLPPSSSRRLPPTWPGTVAVAEIRAPSGGILTAVSVHAVGDHHPIRSRDDGYSTSTLHHALSDLTGYLADRSRHGRMRGHSLNRLILGGDLNINPGWDQRKGNSACRNALERIEAWGLTSVLPIQPDRTYETCPRAPYPQIDYLFVRDDDEVTAAVLDGDPFDPASDHRPVTARLELRNAR